MERYTWDDVELLIVGAGTMGASLAQCYAQNGFVTGLLDVKEEILQSAFRVVEAEFAGAVKARIFSPEETCRARGRILGSTSYEEACAGRSLELVIEAATERMDVKKRIFADLDRLCRPETVLATNSSSLDANELAAATRRPNQVVWMHYFYLPHKNRGAEYAATDTADERSMATARRFLKLGGKIPTLIRGSRRGGAADIIFVALLHEATRMVEEGHDLAAIEAAGREAYRIPVGFLALMDHTGLAIGLHSMRSFSTPQGPDDALLAAYGDYFAPRPGYAELVARQERAADPGAVRWIEDPRAPAAPADAPLVKRLAERFLAVGFAASCEVVEAGLVTPADLDRLAQNAFLWREGPFALMNRAGVREAWRMVRERAELARRGGGGFPRLRSLPAQAESGSPWPLAADPIEYETEEEGRFARVTLSSAPTANAMDPAVFDGWERAFARAYEDAKVRAVIVDSAPIKTFIAGANIAGFVRDLRAGDVEAIVRETERWQRILFHVMTGAGKPKVAIVDGAAYGGGVETALAFAADPDTVVIATERTRYSLPETRLGIYPGLRGTLTLGWVIRRATGDDELALAMARWYTLCGGTETGSPRLLRHLGLADLIVPARDRDRAAARVARALAEKGRGLAREELDALGIAELPRELTLADRDELRVARSLMLKPDYLPALYAAGRDWTPLRWSGEAQAMAQRAARRAASNSAHAVMQADRLINRGFAGAAAGKSLDELARWELEHALPEVFQHPDALEGLTAALERRAPAYDRRWPL